MLFNPITTIPLSELLNLWGELVEAYHGVHGYGSDTAEIYAYRLQAYSPMAHDHKDEKALHDCAINAAEALAALCIAFEGAQDCRVTIDNMAPNAWLAASRKGGVLFNHRAYIRVVVPSTK